MQIPAMPSVECAILHEDFRPIDGNIIFQAIQEYAQDLGFGPDIKPMITSTEKDIHVLANNHRILVSQNPEPLAIDGFKFALSTPYTSLVFPSAADAVRNHKANTFVTIGKGVIDFPHEMRDLQKLVADQTSFQTSEEAIRAQMLCHRLTKLIISNHPATGLHWTCADNLVPQSFYESATEGENLALMNLRPILTSSAGKFGDGLPLGMIVSGSQWLIGRIIEFEEAPVPLPWMLQVLTTFVKVCQIRDSIIPHNESFSVEGEDWSVGVYHEAFEHSNDFDKVRLVVAKAPQFGINYEVTSKRTLRYENAADIRARADQEKRDLPGNQTARKNKAAQERNYTNQELREFAIQSSMSQTADNPAPQSPGNLFARMKSKFLH